MTSFPRQQARTRRFSLGAPRRVTLAPDGDRLVYLRTGHGEDPVTGLWELDLTDPAPPRLLVDPRELAVGEAALPEAERQRRERARELAGGITDYGADARLGLVAFTLAGAVWTVSLPGGAPVHHPVATDAFDPRPAPDGSAVAYVSDGGLHLLELVAGPRNPGVTRPLVQEPAVSWGRAEFIAAEEMGRHAGFWWGPDGDRIAVARVDERAVPTWHLADPALPWQPPSAVRYPAAGTANAEVRLAVLGVRDDRRRVDVSWDRERFPYLARVSWGSGPLTLQVQTRDQRCSQVLRADPDTGACTVVAEQTDRAWVELVPGAPTWYGEQLVTVEDRADHGPDGSRALVVAGEVVSPPGLQVRGVVGVARDQVVVVASPEPTVAHLFTYHPATGLRPLGEHRPGVDSGTVGGDLAVRHHLDLDTDGPVVEVLRIPAAEDPGPAALVTTLPSAVATPVVTPRVQLLELGPTALRAALLLPAGDGPAPVLLDPYGGPHAQRVLRSRGAYLTSQWFADQGFAVLVVDGRGTPGRGPGFERAVHHDLAGPVLADQLTALRAAAELEPRLDLSRVAIRGWSFGGTLAALAVLRAPDVVRAAVAGAPVTDWRLYDTHYTERYLGQPDTDVAAYDTSSLVGADGRLLGAAAWSANRPPELLVIHGLVDDNVVAAHSVRLSAALLADGRPHRFLPLSGVTHLASQEDVAEQLLLAQVAFLRRALDLDARAADG